MKVSTLKSLLLNACAYFTLAVCLLCLLQLLFGEGPGASARINLAADRVLWMLPFGLCLAAVHHVRCHTALSGGLKFFFHMCGTLLGFFLFVYLPASVGAHRNPVVIFSVFLLIYLLGVLVYFLFHRRWRDQKDAESGYQSQYSKFQK
jgi:nitrate/nitrite transporter NarK